MPSIKSLSFFWHHYKPAKRCTPFFFFGKDIDKKTDAATVPCLRGDLVRGFSDGVAVARGQHGLFGRVDTVCEQVFGGLLSFPNDGTDPAVHGLQPHGGHGHHEGAMVDTSPSTGICALSVVAGVVLQIPRAPFLGTATDQ